MKGQGPRTGDRTTRWVAVLVLSTFIPVPSFPHSSATVPSRVFSQAAGQEAPARTVRDVDPFYLAALDKGEKAFQAGDDRQAAASLEVAVFGLGRRPDLLLRAQSRLAVCWHRLRNLDKSRAALQKTVKLIEASGTGTAALDKDIAAELKATADSLQVRLPGGDIKAGPVRPVEAPIPPPAEVKIQVPVKPAAEPSPLPVTKAVPAPVPPPAVEKTEVPVKPVSEPVPVPITKVVPALVPLPAEIKTQVPVKPAAEPLPVPVTKAIPAPVPEPAPTPVAKTVAAPVPEKKGPARKTSLRKEPEDVRLPEPGEKAAMKTEKAEPQAKPAPAMEPAPAPVGQEVPAPVIDRKAPADKVMPVVTEMDLLESTLKIDPSNSGNAYRLCRLYLEQERFQEARRVLRNLILRLPKETRAPIMLARAEYSLKNYTEALSLVHRMSDPFTRSRLDRDDDLRISIYSALCLRAMNQNRSSLSFYVVVSGASSPDDLRRLLREDGLEKAWKELDSAFSDKTGPRS